MDHFSRLWDSDSVCRAPEPPSHGLQAGFVVLASGLHGGTGASSELCKEDG